MFTLPELPYRYDALEPYIDVQTMTLHHDKHHQTYVDKLNAALESQPDWQGKDLDELLKNLDKIPEVSRAAVRNHGGGHANHSLFWQILSPEHDLKPDGALDEAIIRDFRDMSSFQAAFTTAAMNQFGSGWAWLVVDQAKKLKVMALPNQDSPVSQGLTPILTLDVWEHAYYLKYQNRRNEYVENFWHVVNWQEVGRRFEQVTA